MRNKIRLKAADEEVFFGTSEQYLCAAVLMRAVEDAVSGMEEARGFFQWPGNLADPFSAYWLCAQISASPEYLLKRLQQVTLDRTITDVRNHNGFYRVLRDCAAHTCNKRICGETLNYRRV